MLGYKCVRNNLYSADLINGRIDFKTGHYSSCFFIVQHTDDREFIKKQAIQLLVAGCQDFHFFGEKQSIWRRGFDEAILLLQPNATREITAQTKGWCNLEEFVMLLHNYTSFRPLVPTDSYLLYDHEESYKEVLRRLDTVSDKVYREWLKKNKENTF